MFTLSKPSNPQNYFEIIKWVRPVAITVKGIRSLKEKHPPKIEFFKTFQVPFETIKLLKAISYSQNTKTQEC